MTIYSYYLCMHTICFFSEKDLKISIRLNGPKRSDISNKKYL